MEASLEEGIFGAKVWLPFWNTLGRNRWRSQFAPSVKSLKRV